MNHHFTEYRIPLLAAAGHYGTLLRKELRSLTHDHWHLVLVLGLLLLAALAAGSLAGFVRLPKVTAYLLTGMLLGSSGLGWFDHDHIESLEPLTQLAIALILFGLGCHFPLTWTKRLLRHCLRPSLAELLATSGLVMLGLLIIGLRWQVALLLGVLAMESAAATTILVLRQAESDGPLTDYTGTLVVLNNLAVVVLFEIALLAVFIAGSPPETNLGRETLLVMYNLAGAVAIGASSGLIVSFTYGLVGGNLRLTLLLALILLPLSLTKIYAMPHLLTFLTMGFVVANCSDQRRQILDELRRITGLLAVVFFVVHGTELSLVGLYGAGVVGLGYVLLRAAGKYVGVSAALRHSREEPAVRRWLGATLLAHAGAAIALSRLAVERAAVVGGDLPDICRQVQMVVLGAVVVFEIIGPLLIHRAVIRAGEVPLGQAVSRPAVWADQARTIWNRLLLAGGRNPWKGRAPEEVAVREVMRKNVKTVAQDATFAEVVDLIEHSLDNTYPVVDRDGDLVGMIRYRELSSALFDPDLGRLVLATDLATSAAWVLEPDAPIDRAVDLFKLTRDDCLPVVASGNSPRLLGVVRRRDVVRLLARGHSSSQGSSH